MSAARGLKDMVAGIVYEAVFTLAVIAWAGFVAAAALFFAQP